MKNNNIMSKKVGFIGAGKVGVTLGRYFIEQESSLLHVSGYYSKSKKSSEYASMVTHSADFHELFQLIDACDLIFITVPDGEISNVWKSVINHPFQDKIFCHCSGVLSSAVFQDSSVFSSEGYAIHPLFAISDKKSSYLSLKNAHFTLEGQGENQDFFQAVFEELGNQVTWISSDSKEKYHAAAVFASNLVLANLKIACDLLLECGYSLESAQAALIPIVENNVENFAKKGLVKALTGPVQRGDVQTIAKHLEVLSPECGEIYQLLSEKLVSLAREQVVAYPEEEVLALLRKNTYNKP